MSRRYSIRVAKENLKFSAAHFIAYPGFREPLHGHNYQVAIEIEGALAPTGYVIDFGSIKRLTKEIVDRLDARTIVPAKSDCLEIEGPADGRVRIRSGADEFVFPASDVFMAPIVHSSAEELAHYIADELARALEAQDAMAGVTAMAVSVAEGPGQSATYRREYP
ncbi:MAG: 6-pyruvoyl trahydropterin synthase family protein [Candidatus Binataceae bacterium]